MEDISKDTVSHILWNDFTQCNGYSKSRLSANMNSSSEDTWNVFNRLQYIPRNMHTVFALLCFVVVIHWLIFPYPSGLLHWHCGNLTIAPVPAKQPWWIWINTSCEFIMNDCITTTKQSTTKPCAYFLGYTVCDVTCNRHVSLATIMTWVSRINLWIDDVIITAFNTFGLQQY